MNEFWKKLEAGEVAARIVLDLTANQILDDDTLVILAREVKCQGG